MTRFTMIHHVDQGTVERLYGEYAPVFILSTGRSGSKFIVELLNSSADLQACHEPVPCLQYFSGFAYRHRAQPEVLAPMIDAARMELVLSTYITGRVYIESNQCLTFFAPAIASRFRGAKFVHLVRHPGDFVRSAVRKGWYRNDSLWESGRARMADESQWQAMDQIQKLTWLWVATHEALEEFKGSVEPARVLTVRMEDLTQGREHAERLFGFAGSRRIDWGQVERVQGTRINELHVASEEPPNMRKVREYPAYADWPEARQRSFREQVAGLAGRYGYEL